MDHLGIFRIIRRGINHCAPAFTGNRGSAAFKSARPGNYISRGIVGCNPAAAADRGGSRSTGFIGTVAVQRIQFIGCHFQYRISGLRSLFVHKRIVKGIRSICLHFIERIGEGTENHNNHQ